ncbi:MAG: hemolysin family protein [Mariniblastus sp.]|nr:hemolysin family protein [Mariniblastus sp.]MDG2182102.1 hemolysin family protein [Mariniblastus sp.]
MPDLLFWCLICSGVITTYAAIASFVLNEIAWHELEEYCKQKKQPKLFGVIFDFREQMTLGAGILQMIATAVFAVTLAATWIGPRQVTELSATQLTSIIGLVCFSLVFCGSWIPWAVGRVGAVPFLFRTWRWWWMVSALAWPLLVGGRFVTAIFARASGQDDEVEDEEEAFEDEILSMVSEGEQDGFLESDARDMIEGVMELDDNDVSSVMTHRSQVDALEENTDWDEMLRFTVESGRTRIPVYQEKIDNIVGLLYAKDLLRESLRSESKRKPLRKLLRDPLFVPETTLLDEMLSKFLHVRTHMAIIKDEYGGFAGVITIEDIIEEIVGEIVDETDKDMSEEITILNDQQADVLGTVHIGRLNETLGIELPEDDHFDTLSGLIMQQLNEIPRPGRELVLGRVQFNIQEANRRQIKSVRITRLEDDIE